MTENGNDMMRICFSYKSIVLKWFGFANFRFITVGFVLYPTHENQQSTDTSIDPKSNIPTYLIWNFYK